MISMAHLVLLLSKVSTGLSQGFPLGGSSSLTLSLLVFLPLVESSTTLNY